MFQIPTVARRICSKCRSELRIRVNGSPKSPQWQRHSPLSTTAASAAPDSAPPQKRVIFSGIQPSGVPHLGNYLGALREWVRLQETANHDDVFFYSIVDLHALTIPPDRDSLLRRRKEALATLLAIGLDPKKSNIFIQSAVPEHSELMWILSTVSTVGYLSRMTQWKSKLQIPKSSTLEDHGAARLQLGLFSYPVLMAADVLVHGTTHIPVGEDQIQHIEFARQVAHWFNETYAPVFANPEGIISPAKRIMSLKNPRGKMSKSDPSPRSMILLSDSSEEIHEKFRFALTDSLPSITYEPENRPGLANMIQIIGHIEASETGQTATPDTFEAIAKEFRDVSFAALKGEVATRVANHLAPIRERYLEMMSDKKAAYLDDVARDGADAARRSAAQTMRKVREAVGLWVD